MVKVVKARVEKVETGSEMEKVKDVQVIDTTIIINHRRARLWEKV